MTQEEINAKTQEKVNQIKSLCAMLKIQVSAETAITEGGIIRNMVYFLDTEKYDMGIPTPEEMMPTPPDEVPTA
jgi:N-acetylglucosamine kinase-like BadF-type ATPase